MRGLSLLLYFLIKYGRLIGTEIIFTLRGSVARISLQLKSDHTKFKLSRGMACAVKTQG